MIKGIVFDFDGVLIESTEIKMQAFGRLFSKWPDKVDTILAYHVKNMGISRYVKFKHIYENIIHEPYSREIERQLGREFSVIVIDQIKEAPLVRGTKEFLERHYGRYLFFVASGTPQQELQDVVAHKGLNKYFRGIFGSPADKSEILETIVSKNALEKDDVVFVGDAESDQRAAEVNRVHFILRATLENSHLNSRYRIADLTEIERAIKEFEQ